MLRLRPEPWQEISPNLDHALSLSEQERVKWFSDLCEQRSDIANRFEELLHEYDSLCPEHFLEHPRGLSTATLTPTHSPLRFRHPRKAPINSYRLERLCLLIPQRHHRINLGCPPGRPPGCEQAHN